MTKLEHPLLMSIVPTKNTKQGIIHVCKNVNIGMSKNEYKYGYKNDSHTLQNMMLKFISKNSNF